MGAASLLKGALQERKHFIWLLKIRKEGKGGCVATDCSYNKNMAKFEWDEQKRQKTLDQRGLDFTDAQIAFEDPYAFSAPDPRYDSDDRWLLLGRLKDVIVVLAYKELSPDVYRIISMRFAEKIEIDRYEKEKASHLPSESDPLVRLLEQFSRDRELKEQLSLLEEETKERRQDEG